MLVVSLVVFAAGDWRTIGQTEAGDQVSVSSIRILKNNQRIALVRVEFKEPAELPQGGPFVEMRARALQLLQRGRRPYDGMVLFPRPQRTVRRQQKSNSRRSVRQESRRRVRRPGQQERLRPNQVGSAELFLEGKRGVNSARLRLQIFTASCRNHYKLSSMHFIGYRSGVS